MKLFFYRVRTGKVLQCVLITFFSLYMWMTASAQSITCTTLHQPCNADGVLAVAITGIAPPFTIDYYDAAHNVTTHNTSIMYDTLYGITSVINEVRVSADSIGVPLWVYATGMVAPFTVDPAVTTNAVCPSLTGTAQVTINGGMIPVSVQWYSGVIGTTPVYAGSGNPVTLPPGNYNPTITDAAGCVVTSIDSMGFAFIQNISGISVTRTITPANCTNGTATATAVTGGIPPYTYSWSNGATTPAISGLSQGPYLLTVTDMQGCFAENLFYVDRNVVIEAYATTISASCLQNDGSITMYGSGGTPPYTYLYDNGVTTQTLSGLPGNVYHTVTVTDANGCTGGGAAYVGTTSPVQSTYTSINSSCTAPTGSATLSITGGTAPYNVSWSTLPSASGLSLTNVNAGTYPFVITDVTGCMNEGAVIVPPQSSISTFANAVNPVCPATTGAVAVYVSGSDPPFSYTWSNGATTAVNGGIPTGTYTCVITDNLGCSVTKNVTLTTASPIHVGLSATNASCRFSADGSIFSNPVGGATPYTYQWSNGQTAATATGLLPGDYYVTVTDASGCTNSYPDTL